MTLIWQMQKMMEEEQEIEEEVTIDQSGTPTRRNIPE